MENSPPPVPGPPEPQNQNHHLPPVEAIYPQAPPQPQFVQPPTYNPAVPQPAPPQIPQEHTNASTIILQWLTYALWGWTVLAMSILTALVLKTFLDDSNSGAEGASYAIAAILVLLPASIICDVFYSKKEPVKKTGAASIVMVLHAVLFALFGVAALISFVFSIVTLLTSSSESKSTQVWIYSSIIIALLYAALLLRTLHPAKYPWIRRYFIMFMVLVVGVMGILGIIGPTAKARATRTDRLIEENISSLSENINTYTNKNHRLPNDLTTLDLSGDTKKLVTDKIVEYEANSKPATSTFNPNGYENDGTTLKITTADTTYYYQLCVTYKESNKDRYGGSSYNGYNNDPDGYTSYLTAYSHDAGRTCYKVKTTPYNY